jgi:hypothetical protein
MESRVAVKRTAQLTVEFPKALFQSQFNDIVRLFAAVGNLSNLSVGYLPTPFPQDFTKELQDGKEHNPVTQYATVIKDM